MKSLTVCGLAMSVAMLGGCASMHDSTMSGVQAPAQQPTIDLDYAYMAQIEHQARMHNAGIEWVNPPTKRNASDHH